MRTAAERGAREGRRSKPTEARHRPTPAPAAKPDNALLRQPLLQEPDRSLIAISDLCSACR